ncbi:MAG: TrbC/VirB2 family protein [Sphingomonadales bacterium]|nr:TrbC/VirB2 family protein [Sphingomonadales bacterium]MDE2568431.1 TrbC/VirB2 family protein [Sphingomonadales bacterium]
MNWGGSLFETSDSSTLAGAAQWIEGTLLGSVATTVCIVAVAILGLMLLRGRIAVRDGLRVLLGCFLLLGAPAIAAGLLRAGDITVAGEAVRGPYLPAP